MIENNIASYYNKPCKFKLRGGKEVYGVIWEDETPKGKQHYFASAEDYHSIQVAENVKSVQNLRTPINIDDVVVAEMLKGLHTGKNMFK